MNVTLPNGTVIENVPEGTTKEQVKAKAIAAGLATEADFGAGDSEVNEPAKGSMTPEQYAERFGDAPDIEGYMAPDVPPEDASFREKAIGAGEAALTTVTGATGGTLGMLGGTLRGLAEEIRSGEFGTQDAADRIENFAAKMASEFTYSPRTKAGQEYVETIGEVGQAAAPLAGLGGQMAAISQGAKSAPVQATVRRSNATEPVRDSVTRSQDTGVRLTRGETLRSTQKGFDELKQEQFLLEQSGEAGDAMRLFKLEQSREVKNYLESLSPEKSVEVGAAVKDALRMRDNSARYKRAEAYGRLANLTEQIDVGLSDAPIKKAMPDAGEMRDFSATNTAQYNALKGLFEEFGILDSDSGPFERLSIANQERFRKRLGDIEQSDITGQTSRIVGPIREALDNEFELASKAIEVNGAPDVAMAAKAARQSHVALKTEFDEKGLVNDLIASKSGGSRIPKIEESQVYSKLMARSTPIEKFNSVVNSLDRAGSRGKLAKDSMKAEVILDLLDSSYNAASRTIQGEKVFSGNAFSKRYDMLEPKIKRLFNENELKRLEAMRKQAEEMIPPSGAIPKGSAGFFIDAAANLGVFTLLNKIPVAGPVVANQIQELSKSAKATAMAGRAVEGFNIRPETKVLIETQYPRLATGLGLTVGGMQPEREESDTIQTLPNTGTRQ